ncbi:MAG: hypothetical protein WCP31_04345 [Chloroflexales bacterium]
MRKLVLRPFFGLCLLLIACASGSEPNPPTIPSKTAVTAQRDTLFLPLILLPEKNFFVAPNGSALGDGSLAHPWDLATALAQPKKIVPGMTIWLRGGTYRGPFTSTLTGSAAAPITVRQYPGERAIIDSNSSSTKYSLVVAGDWAVYWGFEVTNSDLKRVTAIAGSFPDDLNRSIGINVDGAHTKFINLIIHDVGIGIGVWNLAQDAEVYGSIIYNNGWQGPDRGHGHAIYAQSDTGGTKRIVDNILFNQFSHGIHAYAEAGASLKGFYIAGNIAFNNGSISTYGQSPNILVGGDVPAERVTIEQNYTYDVRNIDSNVELAYSTTANKDLLCQNNYFVGGNPSLNVRNWNQITMSGNQVIGSGPLVGFPLPADVSPSAYQWNNNTYYGINLTGPFAFRSQATNFTGWKKITGFDSSSTYSAASPSGVKVVVRPNQYEPGRANIVVYNWSLSPTVDVDVSAVVPLGATYTVHDVQNYFGAPVLQGTYDGTPLRLPLAGVPPPIPIGGAITQPQVTGPAFNAFVITSTK